jgi:probable phosphoglycerate mutase
MSTTFVLLRHGEKERGFGDSGLTEYGARQAAALGGELMGWGPPDIVSSTLARARETAAIIARILGVDTAERDDLVERKVEAPPGGGRDAFRQEWGRIDAERDYVSYAGESSRMAGARLANALRAIADGGHRSRIAVVTHGGIVRDFVLNVEEVEPQPEYSIGSLSASDIPLASGTIVTLGPSGFAILAVGLVGDDLTRELGRDAKRHPTC